MSLLDDFEEELKKAGFMKSPQSELPPEIQRMVDALMGDNGLELPSNNEQEADYVENHIKACLADITRQIKTDNPKDLENIDYLKGYLRALKACHCAVVSIREEKEIHFWTHCAMVAVNRVIDICDPFRNTTELDCEDTPKHD